MSETYSYTYSSLIDKVIDGIKSKYKNIDSLGEEFNNTVFAKESEMRTTQNTKGVGGDDGNGNGGGGSHGRGAADAAGNYEVFGHGAYGHGSYATTVSRDDPYRHNNVDFVGRQGRRKSNITATGTTLFVAGSNAQLKQITLEHEITNTASGIAVQQSSQIKEYLVKYVPTYCKCDSITDNVTTKGLLAFFNFVLWVLYNSTTVVQTVGYGDVSSVDLPCFTLNTAEVYPGLENDSDLKNVIYKSDFDSILKLLESFSGAIKVASLGLSENKYTCNSCSSCCSSSSCSSSCSSSSCSSSCSSSSSSSSSSTFIAYLNIA